MAEKRKAAKSQKIRSPIPPWPRPYKTVRMTFVNNFHGTSAHADVKISRNRRKDGSQYELGFVNRTTAKRIRSELCGAEGCEFGETCLKTRGPQPERLTIDELQDNTVAICIVDFDPAEPAVPKTAC